MGDIDKAVRKMLEFDIPLDSVRGKRLHSLSSVFRRVLRLRGKYPDAGWPKVMRMMKKQKGIPADLSGQDYQAWLRTDAGKKAQAAMQKESQGPTFEDLVDGLVRGDKLIEERKRGRTR